MKRRTFATVIAAASIVGLTACGGGSDPLASDTASGSATSAAPGGAIVVGGANFSESTLLAEIYAGALRAKGVDATTKPNIGSREIYLRALEDNSVQVFPEYTGALAFNYDKDYAGTDPEEVLRARQGGPPGHPDRARQVIGRGQRLDRRDQGDGRQVPAEDHRGPQGRRR